MRVLVAPDSWKGSLPAARVARLMADGLRHAAQHAWGPVARSLIVEELPMADGGEGTMEAVSLAVGGRFVCGPVRDAYGRTRVGRVLILPDGRAVIEAAEGPRFEVEARRPGPAYTATSAGLADLLHLALTHGAREVLVTLGGTGSSDGGSGFLAALPGSGAIPAEGLAGLEHRRALRLPPLPCPMTVWCDVTAPLAGPEGAVRRYGPQKGLSPVELGHWDAIMEQWGQSLAEAAGRPVAILPGAGAAGGLGAALAALGADLRPGGPEVANTVGLGAAIAQADWVVTGEGTVDAQSLQGKVVGTVWAAAESRERPVIVVTPVLGEGLDALERAGVRMLTVLPYPMEAAEAMREAPRWAYEAGRRLAAWIGPGSRKEGDGGES